MRNLKYKPYFRNYLYVLNKTHILLYFFLRKLDIISKLKKLFILKYFGDYNI